MEESTRRGARGQGLTQTPRGPTWPMDGALWARQGTCGAKQSWHCWAGWLSIEAALVCPHTDAPAVALYSSLAQKLNKPSPLALPCSCPSPLRHPPNSGCPWLSVT